MCPPCLSFLLWLLVFFPLLLIKDVAYYNENSSSQSSPLGSRFSLFPETSQCAFSIHPSVLFLDSSHVCTPVSSGGGAVWTSAATLQVHCWGAHSL